MAQSYRAELEIVAPDACRRLDARMLDLGQRWVVPQPVIYGENDLLTADLVADYCGVTLQTVYVWRSTRGLPSIETPDGIRFRFGEVRSWMGGDRR